MSECPDFTEARAAGYTLRFATIEDRCQIYSIRHDVYACELGQHACNDHRELHDTLDEFNEYIVVALGDELTGFLSITPPGFGRYSLDKYLERTDWPFEIDEGLYEVRLLTVIRRHRSGPTAMLLMHAAQRFLEERQATRVMAIGRRDVLGLYLRVGFRRLGPSFLSGAVRYDLLSTLVQDIPARTKRFEPALRRLSPCVTWKMDGPFLPGDRSADPAPDASEACPHGGAFFEQIGTGFDTLERRHDVINADVLDAWFPPAPAVVQELGAHLDWALRTSPPTACEGLMEEISRSRGVPRESVVAGAGSSDLIFRAFPRWLKPGSRVLLLDPTYGEYQHVLQNVIGCQIDRLTLQPEDLFTVNPADLAERIGQGYDLVVIVNPNNPTGRHIPRRHLAPLLGEAPSTTRVWIDEAYLDYVSPSESLERFAGGTPNVVVCKSLSKVYALSGARAAYLCGSRRLVDGIRSVTPPWVVGLPSQIAGVLALRDPEYYAARYRETHELRHDLGDALVELGLSVWPGVANFLLCRLPESSAGAAALTVRCRRHGLFLRDVSSMMSRPEGQFIRVAVKDAETNSRMIEILRKELMNKRSGSRQIAEISMPGTTEMTVQTAR